MRVAPVIVVYGTVPHRVGECPAPVRSDAITLMPAAAGNGTWAIGINYILYWGRKVMRRPAIQQSLYTPGRHIAQENVPHTYL